MMRYALRRLLILPLMLVLAVAVFVLLPVVGAVQAIVALGVVVGRHPRWRALRLWVFAAVCPEHSDAGSPRRLER